MCSIFGMGLFQKRGLNDVELFRKIVNESMICNITGGRTASGIAINSENEMVVFKQPKASVDLIKTPEYKKFIETYGDVNKVLSV